MRCSLVILPGGGGQQQEDAALADTAEQVAETVVDVALNMFFQGKMAINHHHHLFLFFWATPIHTRTRIHTYTDTHPCSPSTSWGRWGPSPDLVHRRISRSCHANSAANSANFNQNSQNPSCRPSQSPGEWLSKSKYAGIKGLYHSW